ncbi:MAG: aminodeoxychorismate synthase component I [Acidobacteriota bacterium]|nr:aminodeoxychorismate synthase component I [Acidobacteriota bacterium]
MSLVEHESRPVDGEFRLCWRRLRRGAFPFLLDSALATHPASTRSLAGADPFLLLEVTTDRARIIRGGEIEEAAPEGFGLLRRLCDEVRGRDVMAVGYLGYDLGGRIERLPRRAVDDQGFPELVFAFYDRWIEWDHHGGGLRRRGDGAGGRRVEATALDPSRPPSRPAANFTREGYLQAVEQVRAAIARGDIYQVNLSQRMAARGPADPHELYSRLRRLSPAPYSALLGFGRRAVISASPEEFLRLEGRVVRTTPIKGTRPRGRDEAEDRRLKEALLASAKDAAELTMIVDLERNDLGRVCAPGSVVVRERCRLEAHPTVWHLASVVEGRLEADRDFVDLLRATFPGGSVTGAPKIRAMEIIDELEPTRRGVFTGAIGMIEPASRPENDRLRLSVAIRTMHFDQGWVTFQVGGAVVWDSDPEGEYRETLVKARALGGALGLDLEV